MPKKAVPAKKSATAAAPDAAAVALQAENMAALLLGIKALTDKVDQLSLRVDGIAAGVAKLAPKKPAATVPGAAPKPAAKPVVAGGASAAPPKAEGPLVNVALIGARSHGSKHIAGFLGSTGCRISHICDADKIVGRDAVEDVFTKAGYRPKLVQDFRELLKDDSVHAVSIATPHHWHAVMAVAALQAGKHVYVEKPVTHNLNEGPVLLAAARKYGKVVQAGTQLRSNTSLEAAGKYMRSGELGKITGVHCLIHKDRPPLPLSNENPVPSGVDLELWNGPAEPGATMRSKFHYHWHWFWRFGNGALGNNGVHRMDATRIALDLKGYGDYALSIGGRFGPFDGGETPNNQLTIHKFGDLWVLQDVLGLKPKAFKGIANGIIFYGKKGTIVYKSGAATLVDENFKPKMVFEGKQRNHFQNFINAVQANKPAAVRGDLNESIISSNLCHVGNISHRLGKSASDEDISTMLSGLGVPKFIKDRFAAQRKNLVENNLTDSFTLGEKIMLQDGDMPVKDNPKAVQLGTNHYQAPFILPDAKSV